MNSITLNLSFLTGNTHKYEEVKKFIKSSGLDTNITQKDVPLVEIQSDSIVDVAVYKVQSVVDSLEGNYFVEDSGLFVDHLHNFPGVFSSYVKEMIGNEGILKLMKGVTSRTASFRSVLALMLEGKVFTFHGEVQGTLSLEIRGTNGFGYDPIFIAEGTEKTNGEISIEEKNSRSHRIRALQKMCDFLIQKEKN